MLQINGRRRACCRSREYTFDGTTPIKSKSEEDYQNLQLTRDMKSVMRSGKWHPICSKCQSEEGRGIYSLRQHANDTLSGTPGRIESIEFTVSNRCNLSCRSCGHTLSSTWQEHLHNNPWYPVRKKDIFPLIENDVSDILKWMEGKDWNYVKYIKIAGGEPMMSKKFFDFIDWLIDNNYAKNIHLTYITNGTFYSDKVADKLKRFKRVSQQISCEGTGKLDEYMRNGTVWDKKQRNIEKWIATGLGRQVNHVMQAYNYHNIANFEKWAENIGFEEYSPIYISNPHWLRIEALPPEYVNEHIYPMLESKPRTTMKTSHYDLKFDRYFYNDAWFRDFAGWTKKTDKLFGKDLRDVVPELGKLIYK